MTGGALGRWFRMPSLGERLREQGVREDVIAAAERTAYGRSTDRALPALAAALSPDEVMLQLVEGRHRGEYGLFALTSGRLVFLPAATGRRASLDLPLTGVLAVSWRMHRGLGIVDVTARALDGPVAVDKILGNQSESICIRIRRELEHPDARMRSDRDPLDLLAELRAMHHAGLIDDAEFRTRKAELFGQI